MIVFSCFYDGLYPVKLPKYWKIKPMKVCIYNIYYTKPTAYVNNSSIEISTKQESTNKKYKLNTSLTFTFVFLNYIRQLYQISNSEETLHQNLK